MTVQTLLTDVNQKVAASRSATGRRADVLLRDVFQRVTTLRQAKRRFADELAPDFHLFDYLRADEIGLSRCLADLLEPNACDHHGKHGQGGLFLDTLITQLAPRVEPLPLADWASAEQCHAVELEHPTPAGRRLDILIRFDNGGLIGIENKPWAGDQPNQLRDYAAYLQKAAANDRWLLIFLSNREPDSGSIDEKTRNQYEKDGHFLRLGYSEANIWLQQAAEKARAIKVRVFVEELMKFIRTQVSGETDMSETMEITQHVLTTRANLESSFLIAQSLASVKSELLETLRDCLASELQKKGFVLDYDLASLRSGETYTGFAIRFPGLKQVDGSVYFEFGSAGLKSFTWGLKLHKDNCTAENRLKIHDMMTSSFEGGKQSEGFAFYQLIDKQWSSAYVNWNDSKEPWLAIYDCGGKDSLARRVVELAERVYAVFESQLDILKAENS
ncbi:PD-(D/E)XK nuclease family protein [Lamprobacter modestohalophilus]|uniref:PD-(D/E)XK nuclease family protein n=1 Tax=Lamprobacter modestohalophilus TaxID=1064514 RepID=UPI002ADEE772|nr:PD-(D/E)XK nuclease family protein [Lamprobacter modestohalophilus]MEA1051238.1 PD-(D/E)XK nuclease family protein [Lamprobacter modestohalophilus]